MTAEQPAVTVMGDRFVRAWPRNTRAIARTRVLPLAAALKRTYRTDAHFAAYTSAARCRLTREALDHVTVTMTAIAFDIDCPAAHSSGRPAPDGWRAELAEKARVLATEHPHPFMYFTRGGARLVYRLPEPYELRTQDDARQWSRDYAVALAYLERRFGIRADTACADWTRLFRLPHATRLPGAQPEAWPVVGNVHDMGALRIDAQEADFDAAKHRSKAFREGAVLTFVPAVGGTHGVLYEMLAARGAIIRPHGANAFVIRCPHEGAHSSGRTGDGSTLLYLPAQGEHVGAIHCFHAHCSHLSVRDWVRLFSAPERAVVQQARGQ